MKFMLNIHDLDRAMKVGFLLLLAFFLAVDPALAQNGGRGGAATRFQEETVIPLLQFAVYAFYAVGVCVVGVGINKFMKVSKGDPQTSPGEAAGYAFGGGGLMALGFIADFAATSMATGNQDPGGWTNRTGMILDLTMKFFA